LRIGLLQGIKRANMIRETFQRWWRLNVTQLDQRMISRLIYKIWLIIQMNQHPSEELVELSWRQNKALNHSFQLFKLKNVVKSRANQFKATPKFKIKSTLWKSNSKPSKTTLCLK
jgi:hypothetical protein